MKVDFNKEGMTINFEKVPRLLYYNEEGHGCGAVFLDGNRIKKLQRLDIESHTRDDKGWHPLKYRIQYLGPEKGQGPQVIGNMDSKLFINIKILDMDEFKGMVDILRLIVKDERISPEIRQEYLDIISVFTNRLNGEDSPNE